MTIPPKASRQVSTGSHDSFASSKAAPARAKISKLKRSTEVIVHRQGLSRGPTPSE